MHRYSKAWVVAMMLGAFAAGCTADVEDPGEAPDIDVEGGSAPEIDVDPVDIDVGTDTQTVVVPDVDVDSPE